MTFEERINENYFKWMVHLIRGDKYPKELSYQKLLRYLHTVEFTYIIPKDVNRAEDGLDLRYRFAYEHPEWNDAEYYIHGPCSVLEMMVALSIRCEESIMDDPAIGNRTGQWFWGMIANLGLGAMIDTHFDYDQADEIIARFLNRQYEPNGVGGLFKIRHCDLDVRDAEIWYQLCWYLDTLNAY